MWSEKPSLPGNQQNRALDPWDVDEKDQVESKDEDEFDIDKEDGEEERSTGKGCKILCC